MNKHGLENMLKVRKYKLTMAQKNQSSFINAKRNSTFMKGKLNCLSNVVQTNGRGYLAGLA